MLIASRESSLQQYYSTMSSISTELFFNEAEFRIIIPNQPKEENEKEDPIAILEAHPREFAFYGL